MIHHNHIHQDLCGELTLYAEKLMHHQLKPAQGRAAGPYAASLVVKQLCTDRAPANLVGLRFAVLKVSTAYAQYFSTAAVCGGYLVLAV